VSKATIIFWLVTAAAFLAAVGPLGQGFSDGNG